MLQKWVLLLPWKLRGEFCCTSSVTAGPSTESLGCPCAPALRRDPLVRPPQSGSPRAARFSAVPVRSCSGSHSLWRTGMKRRAAWTVCSCLGLREYASQQIYKWDPVKSSNTRGWVMSPWRWVCKKTTTPRWVFNLLQRSAQDAATLKCAWLSHWLKQKPWNRKRAHTHFCLSCKYTCTHTTDALQI